MGSSPSIEVLIGGDASGFNDACAVAQTSITQVADAIVQATDTASIWQKETDAINKALEDSVLRLHAQKEALADPVYRASVQVEAQLKEEISRTTQALLAETAGTKENAAALKAKADADEAARKAANAWRDQVQGVTNALAEENRALLAQQQAMKTPEYQEFAETNRRLKEEVKALADAEKKAAENSHMSTKQRRESMVILHEAFVGNYKGMAGSLMVLQETNEGVLGTLGHITGMMGGPMVVAGAAAAAAVAAVGFALYEMSAHAAESWHHMTLLAETVGTTTENIQAFEFATTGTGVTSKQVATALEMFTIKLTDHRIELEKIGVTAKDPIKAFEQLMDIARSIQDPIERNKVMSEALGRGWKELAPFILQGSEALEEAKRAMKIDPSTKEDFEIINRLQIENAKNWEEIKVKAGRALSGIVADVALLKNGMMNASWKDWALGILTPAVAAGKMMADAKARVQEKMDKDEAERAKASNKTMAGITQDNRNRMVSEENAHYAQQKAALEKVHGNTEILTRDHLARLKQIREEFEGKDKKEHKARAEKMVEWSPAIQMAEREFKERQTWNKKQQEDAIRTKQDELKKVNAEIKKAESDQIKAKQETVKTYAKLMRSESDQIAEELKRREKLYDQTWGKAVHVATGSMVTIASSDGSLRHKMEAGWQSFYTGLQNLALNEAASWIETSIKKAVFAEGQRTADAAASAASQAEAVAAGELTGAALAQAYATAAAFASTMTMGGAAVTGGTSLAATNAAAHGMASYAVGTAYVPHDMVAQIHKGERIVPEKENWVGGHHDGPGSGGGSSHSASLALDSDIMAVIQRNGAALVKVQRNHERVSFA